MYKKNLNCTKKSYKNTILNPLVAYIKSSNSPLSLLAHRQASVLATKLAEKNLKRTVAIAKKANTKQTSPKLYLKRACSVCAAYFLCGFNVTIITTFVQTCEIYQFFSENHCKSTILTLKLQWLVIGLKEKFEIQDYDNSGYRLEAQQVWALN